MGTILTIVFIVLKVVGVINFSWFCVFLPIIIEAVLKWFIPILAHWATSEDY